MNKSHNPTIRMIIASLLLLLCLIACSSIGGSSEAAPFPTSTPEEQGIDSQALLDTLDFIKDNYKNIHSLLMLRHGKLVMEVYFPPYTAQDKQNLFSATKSFVSALVGIAIQEGSIPGVDQKVVDYFPEVAVQNMDEQKKNIRIGDLLNMSGGLAADDPKMFESPDFVAFTLNQPMQSNPGAVFNYNSGESHLLAAIVHKTTGKTTFDYAQEKLFKPLGIRDVYWATDASGETMGNQGLMLTPRDMAKFGLMYLQKGQWEGQQIVPAEWVSTTFQTNSNGYAYQWWQFPYGFTAYGYGAQIIYVVPEKDLVVVSTGAFATFQGDTGLDAPIKLIEAVKSDQPLPASPTAQQLRERINSIENPAAKEVPDLPDIASTVNGRTFRLNENDLGWQTVRFDFDGDQAWLTVASTSLPKEQKFEIGLDGLYRMTRVEGIDKPAVPKPTKRHSQNPYLFSLVLGIPVDGTVAMRGVWYKPKFEVTLQDRRDFDRQTIEFIFSLPEVNIIWNSTLDGIKFYEKATMEE